MEKYVDDFSIVDDRKMKVGKNRVPRHADFGDDLSALDGVSFLDAEAAGLKVAVLGDPAITMVQGDAIAALFAANVFKIGDKTVLYAVAGPFHHPIGGGEDFDALGHFLKR